MRVGVWYGDNWSFRSWIVSSNFWHSAHGNLFGENRWEWQVNFVLSIGILIYHSLSLCPMQSLNNLLPSGWWPWTKNDNEDNIKVVEDKGTGTGPEQIDWLIENGMRRFSFRRNLHYSWNHFLFLAPRSSKLSFVVSRSQSNKYRRLLYM